MVKHESQFIVVSPEKPGEEGPVMAIAPGIFETDVASPNHLVQLPPVVDGVELFRGVVLKGFGYIFKKTAAEVMPHDLEVVRLPGEQSMVPYNYESGSSWD